MKNKVDGRELALYEKVVHDPAEVGALRENNKKHAREYSNVVRLLDFLEPEAGPCASGHRVLLIFEKLNSALEHYHSIIHQECVMILE